MKSVNVKSLGDCPYLISLEPKDAIGRGNYGEIRIAYNKNCPAEKLVAKIFKLSDPHKINSALCELKVFSTFPKHPSLVDFKKVKITSKNYLYIIMELCEGSLQKLAN